MGEWKAEDGHPIQSHNPLLDLLIWVVFLDLEAIDWRGSRIPGKKKSIILWQVLIHTMATPSGFPKGTYSQGQLQGCALRRSPHLVQCCVVAILNFLIQTSGLTFLFPLDPTHYVASFPCNYWPERLYALGTERLSRHWYPETFSVITVSC